MILLAVQQAGAEHTSARQAVLGRGGAALVRAHVGPSRSGACRASRRRPSRGPSARVWPRGGRVWESAEALAQRRGCTRASACVQEAAVQQRTPQPVELARPLDVLLRHVVLAPHVEGSHCACALRGDATHAAHAPRCVGEGERHVAAYGDERVRWRWAEARTRVLSSVGVQHARRISVVAATHHREGACTWSGSTIAI
jgi:hypothetical protein